MRIIKGAVLERVRLAYGQDNSIATTRDRLHEARGNDPEYLDSLGLSESDLKHLERHGLAIRGYLPTGRGNKVRWILIKG